MPQRGLLPKKRKPRRGVKPEAWKARPEIKKKEIASLKGEKTSAEDPNRIKPEQKEDWICRRRDEWVSLLEPLSKQDEMFIPVAVLLDLLFDEVSLLEKTSEALYNQAIAIRAKAEREIDMIAPKFEEVKSMLNTFRSSD